MCRKWIYLTCLPVLLGLPHANVANAADSHLVGWWKLDETSGTVAHDSSGYGNDGILFGDPQWGGGGLEFDGDGDYVDCGDGPSLNIAGSVTITGWIRLDGPGDDRKIAGNQDGTTGGYKLGVYGDQVEFEIRTADNVAILNRSVGGGMLLEPGVYHHVAGVYSQGDYIRTYVDGVLDRELSTAELLGTSTATFKLGREPFSDSYFWLGLMDDVRVYRRALTQQEILNIVEGQEEPSTSILYPANGAILFPDIDPQVTLIWPPGADAVLYDVYFGVDYRVVANADPMMSDVHLGRVAVNSYELFALERGGVYYWRIDEIEADGTIFRGDVRVFKIPRHIEPAEELIRNYTPAGWQAEDVYWIRDVEPHNKIDDTIDRSDANSFNVVVNYKRAVQDADIDFLNSVGAQSEVQMRLKYLSSVAVGGLTKDDIIVIARDPGIAFIEQQFGFTTVLNVSVPSICVTPAPGGCPTTVPAGIDGTGINIAIFDSGVDNSGTNAHDAFAGTPFIGGYDAITGTFGDPDDDFGHGTHVASIALGQATANTSRGVAPGAGLIDVRVIDAATNPCGTPGNWGRIVDGLQRIYDNRNTWNVNVINMSIGYCNSSGLVPSQGLDAVSQLIDLAEAMGIAVVAAASNYGPLNADLPTPAAATRAITVAGLNDMNTVIGTDDAIYWSSSRGPRANDGDADQIDELKPEVTAPGENINAAQFNSQNLATQKTGTSMAAPHVAGLAALIMGARTGINAASVKDLIVSTAQLPAGTPASLPAIDPTWNDRWGWGVVNASDAISLATQTDLTFPSYPPAIGWLSPDISHTALKVGQTATVTVKIRNNGPNPANNVRIHFGVHVFSAATPTFYDIGTQIVNIPVNPTGYTPVSIQWVPQAASHQCLKVEIGYSPDTDYSNNKAQRNVTVALSPVQFRVRNTLTEEPARVDFVAKLEYPYAGWTYRVDPPFVTLAASDPPAEIEAELYPPADALPGDEQILHIAAVVDTNSTAVALGGISVQHIVPKPADPGTEGLVAHYAFENDTLDSSGNGLDGIVIGDPAFVDGVKGMALDFYGGNYVDCGGNAEFSFTDAMTVSTWVNIRSVTTAWMAIIAKGENAWRLSVNNQTTGIHYAFTGEARGWQAANTATELPFDEWYHVAATYDPNVGALAYINGVLDASSPNLDGIDTNEMPLLLGENPEATGRLFDGMLDEVKVYNRALSEGEIRDLAGLR